MSEPSEKTLVSIADRMLQQLEDDYHVTLMHNPAPPQQDVKEHHIEEDPGHDGYQVLGCIGDGEANIAVLSDSDSENS